MTAHALTDAEISSAPIDVWDASRLDSLLSDVGEAGLRDILRLFMADLPYLQAQLEAALAAQEARAADAVLAVVLDSAETLGLAALAARVRVLRTAPLSPDGPRVLAAEAARIRFVPSLKHAS